VHTDSESKSIVVLPFDNLSLDPDNALFADGLTEELIADLSKVQALRVISRTSAQRYIGTDKSLPEIASELGVKYVMKGSIRRAGNSLRITAQLIEAATDLHLWADKFTGAIAWVGPRAEAIAAADQAAALAPGQAHIRLTRLVKHGLEDDVEGARTEFTPEFHEWCYREPTWSYFAAAAFALAGGTDDALRLLEHAVEIGWINYPFIAEQDPF